MRSHNLAITSLDQATCQQNLPGERQQEGRQAGGLLLSLMKEFPKTNAACDASVHFISIVSVYMVATHKPVRQV